MYIMGCIYTCHEHGIVLQASSIVVHVEYSIRIIMHVETSVKEWSSH